MEFEQIIAKNLKDYRETFGYTQEHLANLLNVDRSTYTRYESGDRDISIVHLNKIADLFGIELEDLMQEDRENVNSNLAFAFRAEGITTDDISSIAAFQKVVKNYINMQRIANEQR